MGTVRYSGLRRIWCSFKVSNLRDGPSSSKPSPKQASLSTLKFPDVTPSNHTTSHAPPPSKLRIEVPTDAMLLLTTLRVSVPRSLSGWGVWTNPSSALQKYPKPATRLSYQSHLFIIHIPETKRPSRLTKLEKNNAPQVSHTTVSPTFF